MCKVLVIEYGAVGSGNYIAEAVAKADPTAIVEQTDPEKASQLLAKERFDLVIVDDDDDTGKATTQTSSMPNVLNLENVVIFVNRNDKVNGHEVAATLRKPWVFSHPDDLYFAVRAALHPMFRQEIEKYQAKQAGGM